MSDIIVWNFINLKQKLSFLSSIKYKNLLFSPGFYEIELQHKSVWPLDEVYAS